MDELEKKLVLFSVETAEVVEDNPDSRFLTAKIRAFASSKNLNKYYCSEEALQRTASSIDNMPIVYNMPGMGRDFGTHEKPEHTLIAGFVVPDTRTFERLDDGRLALNVISKVWKRYSPKFVEIVKRSDGEKSVSVEVNMTKTELMPDGYTNMIDFEYQAVCILGNNIQEAVLDSTFEVISFAQANEEFKHDYDAEFSNKYSSLDFTIPEKLKKNAKKSLDAYKEKGEPATSVALAMARFLINNEKISIDKVKAMAKYFNQKSEKSDIGMGFYGGKEAFKWSKEMADKIDEIDNKRLSYFDENITFPYTSIKDAPPSIQKLDGVALSVSQANEIAKQADAVGGEYGWPTAIKSWKSRHKIENGRWVKKDDNQSKEELSVKNEDEKDLKQENMAEEKTPEAEEKTEEMAAESEKELPEEEKREQEKEGEDKKESPSEEKAEEEKEKNMSLDANLDVAAILAFLQEETDDYRALVEGFSAEEGEKPFAAMCKFMYGKMCKMSAESAQMAIDKKAAEDDRDSYMAERDALKKFKEDAEAKEYSFAIERTIAEIAPSMPKKEVENIREDSKNYSLETFDAWNNKARSIAFSFVKEDANKKDGITRMQLPWQQNERRKSVWDELEKK